MSKPIKIPVMERFQYCLYCIVTLGFIYIVKVAIKRAIIEAENLKNQTA